jgi:hypothetical protein
MSGYEKKNTSTVFCATRQSPSLNHVGRRKADKATAKAPYDWFSSPHKRRRCVSRRHAIANRAGRKLRRHLLREAVKLRSIAMKAGTWRVMPASYIESKKIVFHGRRLPHELRGMNQLQESREHSQISPRKVTRTPANFKNSTNENNERR